MRMAKRKSPGAVPKGGGMPKARRESDDFGRRARELGPEAVEFMRRLAIVNEFGLWEDCAREACRRAGKCRGGDAECFDERRGELKRAILQHVVSLLCTANVSSDEFYDYLDEVTEEGDAGDGDWEA